VLHFIWFDAYLHYIGFYSGETQDLGLAKGMSSTIKSHTDRLLGNDGSYYNNQFAGGNVLCNENKKFKETLIAFQYSEFSELASITQDTVTDPLVIEYGALYNWYAASEIDYLICADGWHIPTETESYDLWVYVGGLHAGGKLKETGLTYWDTPNTAATNEFGYNGRGAGVRNPIGTFSGLKTRLYYWTSTEHDASNGHIGSLIYNADTFIFSAAGLKTGGNSLRPIKDSTTLTHGQTGTYTGNDGTVYVTVKVVLAGACP
jgi:uncharacterized protein (TIGR02145 family)